MICYVREWERGQTYSKYPNDNNIIVQRNEKHTHSKWEICLRLWRQQLFPHSFFLSSSSAVSRTEFPIPFIHSFIHVACVYARLFHFPNKNTRNRIKQKRNELKSNSNNEQIEQSPFELMLLFLLFYLEILRVLLHSQCVSTLCISSSIIHKNFNCFFSSFHFVLMCVVYGTEFIREFTHLAMRSTVLFFFLF